MDEGERETNAFRSFNVTFNSGCVMCAFLNRSPVGRINLYVYKGSRLRFTTTGSVISGKTRTGSVIGGKTRTGSVMSGGESSLYVMISFVRVGVGVGCFTVIYTGVVIVGRYIWIYLN